MTSRTYGRAGLGLGLLDGGCASSPALSLYSPFVCSSAVASRLGPLPLWLWREDWRGIVRTWWRAAASSYAAPCRGLVVVRPAAIAYIANRTRPTPSTP